jgi:hypothetical protein
MFTNSCSRRRSIVISRLNRRKKLARRKRRAENDKKGKDESAAGGQADHDAAATVDEDEQGSLRSGPSSARRQPRSVSAAIVTGRRRIRGAGLGGHRVQEWRKGLRRRKGGKTETPDDGTVVVADVDGGVVVNEETPDSSTGETRSSREANGNDQRPAASESAPSSTEEGPDSTTVVASTTVETSSEPTGRTVSSGGEVDQRDDGGGGEDDESSPARELNLTRGEIEQVEAEAEAHASAPPLIIGGATAFLPAYRPASIYHSPNHDESSSVNGRDATEEPLTPYSPTHEASAVAGSVHNGRTEKITTGGFYPAPTTLEQEEAVAVVARGERSTGDPGPSEYHGPAPTSGHVATDDKRVLERLMRGASSMPGTTPDDEALVVQANAPVVDVDEDGFERLDSSHLTTSRPGPSALARSSSAVAVQQAPGLPAPPRPVVQASVPALASLGGRADVPSVTPSESPSMPYEDASSQPDVGASVAAATAPSAPMLGEDEEEASIGQVEESRGPH